MVRSLSSVSPTCCSLLFFLFEVFLLVRFFVVALLLLHDVTDYSKSEKPNIVEKGGFRGHSTRCLLWGSALNSSIVMFFFESSSRVHSMLHNLSLIISNASDMYSIAFLVALSAYSRDHSLLRLLSSLVLILNIHSEFY